MSLSGSGLFPQWLYFLPHSEQMPSSVISSYPIVHLVIVIHVVLIEVGVFVYREVVRMWDGDATVRSRIFVGVRGLLDEFGQAVRPLLGCHGLPFSLVQFECEPGDRRDTDVDVYELLHWFYPLSVIAPTGAGRTGPSRCHHLTEITSQLPLALAPRRMSSF